MKKIILSIMLIVSAVGCAPKSDRHVVCAPFFKFDAEGHRYNGFWDIEENHETAISECDEVKVGEPVDSSSLNYQPIPGYTR